MMPGVLTVFLGGQAFEAAFDRIAPAGIKAVEIGSGGFPGTAHCDPAGLLRDRTKPENFKKAMESRGLFISALCCYGNPLHPHHTVAAKTIKDFQDTVLLAEKPGVDRVLTFSGRPGGSEGSTYPNWVTCPWPDDFLKAVGLSAEQKIVAGGALADKRARTIDLARFLVGEIDASEIVKRAEEILRPKGVAAAAG